MSRIVVISALGSLLLATSAFAQTAAPANGHAHPHGEAHNAIEQNPACKNIVAACKKAGFVAGQAKSDNGLWKDCFGPVVHQKKSPTQDGKPVNVSVSASDVKSCQSTIAAAKKQK